MEKQKEQEKKQASGRKQLQEHMEKQQTWQI
jgi:hypothetical protein